MLIEKHFVTYEIAKELKELDFLEDCLANYHNDGMLLFSFSTTHEQYYGQQCLAPLWQQVIDWFRKEYNIHVWIYPQDMKFGYSILCYSTLYEGKIIKGAYNEYNECRGQAILKAIELCKNIK